MQLHRERKANEVCVKLFNNLKCVEKTRFGIRNLSPGSHFSTLYTINLQGHIHSCFHKHTAQTINSLTVKTSQEQPMLIIYII